jgi:flagellar motor switch protein FliN
MPLASNQPSQQQLQRILHLHVPVVVKIAQRKMSLGQILSLAPGSVIEFAKAADEPVELLIDEKRIGTGEVVEADGRYAVRVGGIGDSQDLIRSLGAPDRCG